MKFVRYANSEGVHYGKYEDEKTAFRIIGDIFNCYEVTEQKDDLTQCKILPPIVPPKFIAVGLNYILHIRETDPTKPIPPNPTTFIKSVDCIVGTEDNVVYPEGLKRLDYEGEIACIIKKRCKNVKAENFKDYVLGYTCCNDVSARDFQHGDMQWYRGKSHDTHGTLGPIITDEIDGDNVEIITRLNGEVKQRDNTSGMVWGFGKLIEFISKYITLEQGDVITTGTPCGVGPMQPGDVVEVDIEGIGVLRNYIVGGGKQ